MKCLNCGEEGPHFVPPSLGEPGFYMCKKKELDILERLAVRSEDYCRDAYDEIKHLREQVKHWEDQETHEAMDCYVKNETLEDLRKQVKELQEEVGYLEAQLETIDV